MEPSYTIVPLLKKSSIEPGEEIDIEIYLSGAGDVKRNKLHLIHGYSNLLEEENTGYWVHSLAAQKGESGELRPKVVPDDHPLKYRELYEIGGFTHLNPIHFEETTEITEQQDTSGSWEEIDRIPAIFAERSVVMEDGSSVAPLEIRYNTKPDAEPGDYDINLTFTYESENKRYQDKETITVHVEGWVERNRRYLEIIAAFVGLITSISIIYPVLSGLLV